MLASRLHTTLLLLAATAAAAATPVLEDERSIAKREPPPHGEVGMSVGHSFFAKVAQRGMELRKRTYLPGSEVGKHVIARDQAIYVLEGQGEYTTNGVVHALKPGTMIYAHDNTQIAIRPTGSAPLSLLMAWTRAAQKVPATVLVNERDVAAPEPAPVGEKGRSVNYKLFMGEPGRGLEFRRRTLEVGASIGEHPIPNDQVYYVLQGSGEIVTDGKPHRLEPGLAAYVYDGAKVAVRQTGPQALSYILAFPYPGKPATPDPLVLDEERIARSEPLSGGKGTLWRYTDGVRQPQVELLKRSIPAGASYAPPLLTHDQMVYVQQGDGVLASDGVEQRIAAGQAVYLHAGSRISLRPGAAQPLELLMARALPPLATR